MSGRFVRTYARRKAFLDELTLGGSKSKAAQVAGGKVSNFKAWAESDPDFAKDVEDAINSGTDFIEDVALERALTRSDALMAMMLKARRPEMYDRGSKLELTGGISVQGSKQKLLNKIAKIQAEGRRSLPGPIEEEIKEAPEEAGQKGGKEEKQSLALPAPDSPARGSKRRRSDQGSRRAQA